MSTRITVGLNRKRGQPDYGSHGASCHIDFEIDGDSLFGQSDQLAVRIQEAYRLCRQEVERELGGDAPSATTPSSRRAANDVPRLNGHTSAKGNGQSRIREATDAQIRAIHAIASKANVHLASQLQQEFAVSSPKQLTIRQASELIESLKGRLEAS
ncbi:hypothetical protein [Novipirellula artificiosorum]|uniref:Uncharacterized protein n=1 Tax=Novipirellula artificiosorum TaxID=2528016 RepID=A0A5C6D1Q4_9BACT|nr:hypothetical protein [Novipirellula artificiosorum]TWU31113.1 hypothetical protein Poly41_63040 [Novipirellula artificiosorum]